MGVSIFVVATPMATSKPTLQLGAGVVNRTRRVGRAAKSARNRSCWSGGHRSCSDRSMSRFIDSRRQGGARGGGGGPGAPAAAPPKNYITPRGFKRLMDEHHYLRVVERARVVEEVSHAAALGDRSENAEYIYGKKRLREIDRRLRFLHKRLAAAEVVEPSQDRGLVVYFGATVTCVWPDGGERVIELVGEDEIESELGRISWRSPLGQALMRKKEGDTVRFQHLAERSQIEIVEVVYRAQEPDPPSRWDQHKAARRGEVSETLELPDDLADDDEVEDDDTR
jgi:transcription elongation factor GreB